MSLDVLTLNLAKKYSKSITSIGGTLGSITRQADGNLQITYNPTTGDPIIFNAGVVPPGRSIASASVDSTGVMTLTFDDNTTQTVQGNVMGPRGFTGAKGDKGTDGREVEISVQGGYISWRYVGTSAWTNLVSMDSLVGAQGEAPEFRMAGTTLQYKHPSDANWTDLYNFSMIDIPAEIMPYSVGAEYKTNDVFFDTTTKKIYHVVTNYTAVSIATDESLGYIYSIGGQDIDLSPYAKTDVIFQSITEAQLDAFVADPTTMPSGVRFAVVG